MIIGILEYQKFHNVYAETLAKICEDYNVFFYTDKNTAIKSSKNLDLLFVNTIRPLPWDNLRWLTANLKCKTILTIHEANTELLFHKPILNKFDAISVPLQQIKDYIIENNLYKGKIFTFPFLLHESKYPNENNMRVVPGKIEKFRRNYDFILDSLLKSEKLCLLGEPIGTYGDKIILKCIDLNDRGYNIKYYTKKVPEKEYQETLKECKSILSFLNHETKGLNKLVKEYYGKTKACGAMFEAIRYGKLFINNLNIQIDYKDYLLEDWKKYFKEKVVEEFLNEER